jgi:hypothetical protein
MEHLEADFNKKLAILEERLKSNSDLVTEGNANKAILEKLKDAMGKAEENIQKNQQKIEDLTWDFEDFEMKQEEAEQKAQMANNKVNFKLSGVSEIDKSIK